MIKLRKKELVSFSLVKELLWNLNFVEVAKAALAFLFLLRIYFFTFFHVLKRDMRCVMCLCLLKRWMQCDWANRNSQLRLVWTLKQFNTATTTLLLNQVFFRELLQRKGRLEFIQSQNQRKGRNVWIQNVYVHNAISSSSSSSER